MKFFKDLYLSKIFVFFFFNKPFEDKEEFCFCLSRGIMNTFMGKDGQSFKTLIISFYLWN